MIFLSSLPYIESRKVTHHQQAQDADDGQKKRHLRII